jgi:hypothetical protein
MAFISQHRTVPHIGDPQRTTQLLTQQTNRDPCKLRHNTSTGKPAGGVKATHTRLSGQQATQADSCASSLAGTTRTSPVNRLHGRTHSPIASPDHRLFRPTHSPAASPVHSAQHNRHQNASSWPPSSWHRPADAWTQHDTAEPHFRASCSTSYELSADSWPRYAPNYMGQHQPRLRTCLCSSRTDHFQAHHLSPLHRRGVMWGHPHGNKQAIAVMAPCCLKTSGKPCLPTLLTNQWQNSSSSCGPVWREAGNQSRIYSFIHSSICRRYVKQETSQMTHQETSSTARQTGHAAWPGPGTLQHNWALHQLRHCRSQHSVRLSSSQQQVTTAISCYPGTSPAGSIHHERRACRWAHRHKPLHGDSLLIKTYKLWHACQHCTTED